MDKKIKEQYNAAFSQVRSACENKTEAIMNLNNQKPTIKLSRRPVIAVAAIVLIIALSMAGYAIVMNLRAPGDIAREEGMDKLADAFDNGSGLEIQESIVSNGYVLSLHGLAIGSELNEYRDYTSVDSEETYAIISIAKEDGSPMNYFDPELNTPLRFHSNILFEGYAPWQLNSIFFGLGGSAFEKDGVLYMIYSVGENVEIFADKDVYLAIWDGDLGFVPHAGLMSVSEDGKLSFAEGLDSAHALFTLPLDPAKADPAKVEQLLDDLGIFGDNDSFGVYHEREVEGEFEQDVIVFVEVPDGETHGEYVISDEFGSYHAEPRSDFGGGGVVVPATENRAGSVVTFESEDGGSGIWFEETAE
ncbi:MAG: hypothetical protein FWH20_02990 [Oscillospiraceae bacterium]|nr:hypothetical protein [Oscillospiraceae bacterium]